jgi:hypothetical protein
MIPDNENLAIYEMIFELRCRQRKGSEFQSFFEKIMFKLDPSFIAIKPSGKEGDWKCDGFSKNTGTVYQCYSPEDLSKGSTASKAAKKVKDDFEGAKIHWDKEMRQWIFVWSADGQLPPQVLKALTTIEAENQDLTIDNWSQESLWRKVSQLAKNELEIIIEFSLNLAAAPETTAIEVESLLSYLTRQELEPIQTDLGHIDLQDKLDKNNLTPRVQTLIKNAMPIVKIVEDYTRRHPDIEYSGIIAQVLTNKYRSLLKENRRDSNAIFFALINFVSSEKMAQDKFFWASIGIVSHYFELCDIFER